MLCLALAERDQRGTLSLAVSIFLVDSVTHTHTHTEREKSDDIFVYLDHFSVDPPIFDDPPPPRLLTDPILLVTQPCVPVAGLESCHVPPA